MSNTNVKLWSAALRDGSHTPNGTTALLSFDAHAKPAYSALGVGCNVYRRTTQYGQWEAGGRFTAPGYHPCPTMPPAVLAWYGLLETPSLLGLTFAQAADALDALP